MEARFGNILYRVVIPGGIYPGVTTDTPTLSTGRVLVAHRDLDAELAYRITRLVYENRAELARGHPLAQYITLIGVARRSSTPFHPGAARYFRERGVEGF